MHRRNFLKKLVATFPALYADSGWAQQLLAANASGHWRPDADVIVAGGGLGGCAAAIAAARAGLHVVLTEETDWIGGQLTSQAVPPDEHPWIESFGATATYRRLRTLIRDYYRAHFPLTAAARNQLYLNPGAGMVSRLCVEPPVALAAIHALLAPYISSGRISIYLCHRPIAADSDGDRVRSVTVASTLDQSCRTFTAPYFIDATEMGDLLPLTGTEYVTGFESQRDTGEPHAPSEAQPNNMQPVTWCYPVEYIDGGDFTIDRPETYAFWRDYVPKLSPVWPGKLLSWTYSHPMTLEPKTLEFNPQKESPGWWPYRRIVDRTNFLPGTYRGSVSLVNWPQNDYLLGNICEVTDDERAQHLHGARQLSLSLLYWMQTESPRPDGGAGWPGLRLRPELVGSPDGLAKSAYVRESRRINAVFTVCEQHVSTEHRMRETGLAREEVTSSSFADSVGVGSYRIDLHPSTQGDNYLDLSSLPFEIPLGALIPQRMSNLIAGAKNIGVTHITNGCYRLHPVEWNVGEAAGSLVAFCHRLNHRPEVVRQDVNLLSDFQKQLSRDGIEIRWPRVSAR